MNKLQKVIGFLYIFLGIAFLIFSFWSASTTFCGELPEMCTNILITGAKIFLLFLLLGLFHILTKRLVVLKLIIDILLLFIIIVFIWSFLGFLRGPQVPLVMPSVN